MNLHTGAPLSLNTRPYPVLRSQGADVLQAEHVESYCGEGSVLMHHVGHLGGQVGAGCCEHFAHVR